MEGEIILHTPLAALDAERYEEELKCSLEICKAQQPIDAHIVELLAIKAHTLSCEAKSAALDFAGKAAEVRATHERHMATLRFSMTKTNVDMHKWRQTTAFLQVKLQAAMHDVANANEHIELLKSQCSTEIAARKKMHEHALDLRSRVEELQHALQTMKAQKSGLKNELREAADALEDAVNEIEDLQQALRSNSDESKRDLQRVQDENRQLLAQLETVKERAALAEQTAKAAKERANLAEQTLMQRETLNADRAQLQSQQYNFSHTTELQQERAHRSTAEARAAAAEARAAQVEKELARLNRQVDGKDRRITELEETLKRHDNATPARVTAKAMDAVGALVGQLGGDDDDGMGGYMDDEDEVMLPAMKLTAKGGKKASTSGAAAKPMPAAVKAKVTKKPNTTAAAPALPKPTSLPTTIQEDDDDDPAALLAAIAADADESEEEVLPTRGSRRRASPGKSQRPAASGAVGGGAGGKEANKATKRTVAEEEKDKNEEEEEVMPEKKKRGERKRKDRDTVQQEDAAAEEDEKPDKKKKSRGKRSSKTDSEENADVAANAAGRSQSLFTSLRMETKPLDALNPDTVQAAEKHLKPSAVAKPHTQRSILAPAAANKPGDTKAPGRRMLLGVSSSFGPQRPGPALPAMQLLGGQNGSGFTAPKLAGGKP